MSFPGTSSRSRAVRELAATARRAAIEGRWEEAIEINNALIERSPRDVDALNRLGKAYYELGRFRSAYEAYAAALEADPASIIARRNLERLESLRDMEATEPPESITQLTKTYGAFIQEAGKTYVDDVVDPAPSSQLRLISAGEQLYIQRDGDQIVYVDESGEYVGTPEPRLKRRLAWLLDQGNEYEVFVTANAGDSLRVILREVSRGPNMGDEMSFPEQVNASIPRAYVRDTRLFRADENDLLIPPDDEDEIDEEAIDMDEDDEEEPILEEADFVDDEDDDDLGPVAVDDDEEDI